MRPLTARQITGLKIGIILFIVLAIWANLASYYIRKTPGLYYQMDGAGQVEYTQLIAKEHALPAPHRGWQTYHPPLYYLINQTAHPFAQGHIQIVRSYSVVYGAIVILLLLSLLLFVGVSPFLAAAALLFFITTPSFVEVFTAYNNDSLAMLFAVISVFALYKYWRSPKFGWFILLFLATTLGAYSKYTAIYASIALLALLGIGFFAQQLSRRTLLLAGGAILIGIATLFPWLQFHNKAYTGQYLPQNVAGSNLGAVMESTRMSNNGGVLRFIFTPPGLTTGEWGTPFAISQYRNPDSRYAWMKKNLTSSMLATSSYGEWEYSTVGEDSPFQTYAWLVLWGQLVTLYILIRGYHKKMLPWLVLVGLGVLTHVAHLTIVHQFLNDANYRYYLWVSIPYFVALGLALQKFEKSRKRDLVLLAILIAFIYAHLGFFYYFNP